MDRLCCRALSLSQNSSSKNDDSSNSKIEKSLEEWKLPPCVAADVLKRSFISSFTRDRTVKTVEKEIPLSEGYASFPLFTDNLRSVYKGEPLDLYIGIVEVALKPTKLGSNASAIVCLRDKRRLKFYDSVLGMVESSLSDGPIYFSYVPTHRLDLSDPCLSASFTLDVLTQGTSTMPGAGAGDGDGSLVLMYRFHYKLMTRFTEGNKKKLFRKPVDGKGETTLFVTTVAGRGRRRGKGRRSNGVLSRKIYWDQVRVPEIWMDEHKHKHNSSSTVSAEDDEQGRGAWIEAGEAYALQMDITGFEEGEVKVAVEKVEANRILEIRGVRRKVKMEKGKWQSVVRSSGEFLRRFEVPENAKLDEVKAAVENEVLTVTVPKGRENPSWPTSVTIIRSDRNFTQIRRAGVYVRW